MNSGMGFALSHMEKCGWKEGQGLGREETGMKEAIKVKLKFDNSGFGHDRAEEFKFQWWDHVFNKAAENISVTKTEKGGIELLRKEELVVSKSRPSVSAALMKEKLYGSFVKGATLHGSEEVSIADSSDDESDEDDEPRDMSMKLSDDQLFKLCGGRTAHKGARHGLNMNAKLDRIRQQEEDLMRKWQSETQHDSSQLSSSSNEEKETGKGTPNTKKNKKCKSTNTIIEPLENIKYAETKGHEKDACLKEVTSGMKSKKSKKLDKEDRKDNKIINESVQYFSIIKKKKKHKKEYEDLSFSDKEYDETKKRKDTDDDNNHEKKIKTLIDQDTMTDSGIESIGHEIKGNGESFKRKKKHKNKEGNESIQECESKLHMKEFEYQTEEGQCKRKKKKNKKKDEKCDEIGSVKCLASPDTHMKKSKKNNKKDKEEVVGAGKHKEIRLDIEENNILSTVYKEKKKKRKTHDQPLCNTAEVEAKIQKKKKKKSKSEK